MVVDGEIKGKEERLENRKKVHFHLSVQLITLQATSELTAEEFIKICLHY